MMPLTVLRTIVLLASALPLVYYALAAYSARRLFRTRRRPLAAMDVTASADETPVADFTPPVSILKPVRGLDRTSYDNFAAFCRQDYPEYEIVFSVADDEDPAIDVIRRIIAAFPERSIRLLIGAPELGPSSKVNKLCRLAREARHDLLVISDSDVRVEPDYLRSVVVPFRDARVGAVTCLYTGIADGHLASELEAIGIASDFAAGVVTAWQLEGVKFTLGATMATTRQHLREIGGFEALVTYCAEDFQLGHRLAELGYRVELAHCVVASECAVRTLRDYLRHQLRWAISTRHSRPWGYAGLALTQGLPWAVAATAVVPSTAVAAGYLGAYLALRLLMAWSVATWVLGDAQIVRKWWLLPVRDAFGFVVWVTALFRNRIHWRGREFLVEDGRLIPAGPAHAGNLQDSIGHRPQGWVESRANMVIRLTQAEAPKTLLLAAPRGFCAGVVRAIDTVRAAVQTLQPPVYVLKEIVHNRHVVDDLAAEGAIFVDTLDSVPDDAVVVFSAHGVAPSVRQEAVRRRLHVIDATCPLVAKVHLEAIRYARENYSIVLIGHRDHDEVIGIAGEAPAAIRLVTSLEDVDQLDLPDPTRVVYLTQTTLSVDDTAEIVGRLTARFPDMQAPPAQDICYATQNRQDAVKAIAPRADLLLVVGAPNSSNANRLREVAARAGTTTYLISGAADIRPEWLDGYRSIGVTAGASTPRVLIDEVAAWLRAWGCDRAEEVEVASEDVHFTLPNMARRGQP